MKTITVPDVEYYRQAFKDGKKVEVRYSGDWFQVKHLFDIENQYLLKYEFRLVEEDPYAVFKQAQKEGKVVQHRSSILSDVWVDGMCWGFNDPVDYYRIKPSPKYREWKSEEVPVGALIRYKEESLGTLAKNVYMILTVGDNGIIFANGIAKLCSESTSHALKAFEHSLDHGKTWLPCGVLVEE